MGHAAELTNFEWNGFGDREYHTTTKISMRKLGSWMEKKAWSGFVEYSSWKSWRRCSLKFQQTPCDIWWTGPTIKPMRKRFVVVRLLNWDIHWTFVVIIKLILLKSDPILKRWGVSFRFFLPRVSGLFLLRLFSDHLIQLNITGKGRWQKRRRRSNRKLLSTFRIPTVHCFPAVCSVSPVLRS